MRKTNYHSHTIRCNHATGSEEEFIKAAIKAGYEELGFADHSPWQYDSSYVSSMRMKVTEIDDYVQTLRSLKEKYKDQISIKIGFECEYFPKYMPWLKKMLQEKEIDYIILGHHFKDTEEDHVYYGALTTNKELLTYYVDSAIEAMKTGLYSYMAHPDVVHYAFPKSTFYHQEMTRLCKAAKEYQFPLEFNLLGFEHHRHYPNDQFWQIAKEVGNQVIIGVDAHDTYQFELDDLYCQAVKYLNDLGIERVSEIKFLR